MLRATEGRIAAMLAATALTGVALVVPAAGSTGSDWPTYGHDSSRSGNAAGESMITPANVGNLTLKWSTHVDGKVTAQPLYVSAVQVVGGQTRDVIIAATAGNSIYALDASNGTQIWQRNFGPSDGTGAVPGGFGINGSPVIDRAGGRVFTVSQDGQLRTLSLADGSDLSSPLPVITSNQTTNRVWGGLNLIGANLYIATASDGNDTAPWRGRIFQIDVSGSTPSLVATFVVVPSVAAPNGGGGIWGYGGVSVDPATGRVYAATGADSSESYTPYAGQMIVLPSNLIILDPKTGLNMPLGSFAPTHPSPCVGAPGACDMDFGATPILYQPTGCSTLVAAVSKDGHLYVLKADDLAASAPPIQSLALNNAYDGPGSGGLIGVPAFWPDGNMLFITDAGPGINGINAGVVGLKANPAPACDLQVSWSLSLPVVGPDQPPSSPTVAGGVVFVGTPSGGTVHAYDAATGAPLWDSRGAITGATFAAPMVASGNLYVGSWDGFANSDGGTVQAFSLVSGRILGDQAIESQVDGDPSGVAEGFQTTATANGAVTALRIYLDASSTATRLVAGLYADSAGHPGGLLAQGSSTNLAAPGWNVIPLSQVGVTKGTPYWIAILGTQSGTLRFRDGTGGCVSETSQQSNLTALPTNWTSGAIYSSCPLSAYAASTDTSPPSSTIVAPINGGGATVNHPLGISGTATDTGGGVVAGVEVSVDGGATWHPATGLTSWSYTWTPTASGYFTIKSRAVDDSGNLETPSAGVLVIVGPGCGLGGVELAPILPLLLWLCCRRRRIA